MNPPSQQAGVIPAPERPALGLRQPSVLVADPQQAARLAELNTRLVEGPIDAARAEAERLRGLAAEGAFVRPPEGAVVVYRLGAGEHQQTGVIADVAVDDYRTGRIRRHEATRPDRVRRMEDVLAAMRWELVPLTLTHPPLPGLQSLLAAVTERAPDVETVAADGVSQSVWIEPPGSAADDIRAELTGIDTLYIADGHHRMAAAERYAGPGDFVLGALFPADEMRLLGYHRCLIRPGGMSTSDLIDVLAAQPMTESLRECGPDEDVTTGPGTVAMWLDDRWYRLRLRVPRTADPCASLDVVLLEEGVLGPLAGGTGARILPLPGSGDADSIARWCAEHDAIGFLLHPPGVSQVVAVADAGEVMPPKSTWFDPKARAGPFLRDLRR